MSTLPVTKPSLQRRQQDRQADRQIYHSQTTVRRDKTRRSSRQDIQIWRFAFSTLYQIIQIVIQFNLQHKGKSNGAAYQLSFMNTMPYHMEEVANYAASIGYKDKMILRYFLSEPTFLVEQTCKDGLLIHLWTFKDDARIFQAITNIEMCLHQSSGNAVKWYYYIIL